MQRVFQLLRCRKPVTLALADCVPAYYQAHRQRINQLCIPLRLTGNALAVLLKQEELASGGMMPLPGNTVKPVPVT